MSVTLSNLRTLGYNLLREEENSSAYPYTLIDSMLNSAQQSICAGKVVNPLNWREVRKGKLPFLNSNSYFTNVASTTLSTTTSIWATTLTVADTSNYASSGALFINWNIVTYTGKTSTTFTGCSWVWFAFIAWTYVSQLFSLPADFSSPIEVRYDYKVKLPQKQYDDVFEDLNSHKGTTYWMIQVNSVYTNPYQVPPFYTIIDGKYLAIFNLEEDDKLIHLRYEKKPSVLSITSDVATIDDDIYAKSTIPYLAIGEMLFNRWEEQRGAELLSFWLGKLKEMYFFYNNKTYESISWVQVKTHKWWLNI